MRRNRGRKFGGAGRVVARRAAPGHPMARRVAMASMSVLAAGGIGLVAAPMAFGQIVINVPLLGSSQGANVDNSGSASANTGGNNAVGNASSNSASVSSPGSAVNVPVSLGAPMNTSTGDATITSGPASAAGNTADTGVAQSNASGTQVNSFLAGQGQSAGAGNSGSASANTGGNNAVGNASSNTATVTQNVSGGLVGVGVNLGGPTNNSTGTATINSGAATAAGNQSGTSVDQAALRGGGGFGGPVPVVVGGGPAGQNVLVGGTGGPAGTFGPGTTFGPGGAVLAGGGGPAACSGRFTTIQNAGVSNQGNASANTGGNTAVGNASTNNAAANLSGTGQTVSGGVLGVGISLGGPINNSSGTATINTGPASAVGNNSTTGVTQFEGCPQVFTVAGRGNVIVPAARVAAVQPATLARTGVDTGDLGMLAGALLATGLLLIAAQRRRLVARHAAVPMAGLGFGLGADEWDGIVR